MADELTPLAAALESRWKTMQYGIDYGGATFWEPLATAAREHLSAAPPAAPTEQIADSRLSRLAMAFREFCETMPLGRPSQAVLDELERYANPPKPAAPTERPTCATCPYWSDYAGILPADQTDNMGQCRRRAPKYEPDTADDWDDTNRDDFCGDHPAFPAYIASRRAST